MVNFHVRSPGLVSTAERRAVVDFSLTFYFSQFSIAIKDPKSELKLWTYLSPLHFESWLAILGLMGVSSLTLTMVCQFSRGKQTILALGERGTPVLLLQADI